MRIKADAVQVQRKAVLSEPSFQYAAQLGSRRFTHLSRDPRRNMIGAREDPDVAGNSLEKLNRHHRTAAGNEVARADHQIAGRNRGEELRAERVARACCDHEVGSMVFTLWREQLPFTARSPNPASPFVAYINPRSNLTAGAPGSLQQQSIQRQTREDRDRMLHLKADSLSRRTDQLAAFNRIALTTRICQKRILPQSFVCNSATAGLLPRKLLVKEEDVPSSFRQERTCESSRWTASNNRNRVVRTHIVVKDFLHRRKTRQR